MKILMKLFFIFAMSIFFLTNSFASATQKFIVSVNSQDRFLQLKKTIQSRKFDQNIFKINAALDELKVFLIESEISKNELSRYFNFESIEQEQTFSPPRFKNQTGLSEFSSFDRIGNPSGPLWNVSMVNAPNVWSKGFYGQNTRVMMLDTGIDKDHPSIKDNFEQGKDFAGGLNKPYAYFDSVGHGTHTSGIVAGTLSPMGLIGVAPQAKILMARVCSSQSCSSSAVLNGLNWALQEKVDVVNMSLSRPQSSQAENNAIAKLEAAGIVVVASTGNDGKETVLFPAALPTVIAVGSVNEDLQKSIFSNWGAALDIVAPGADIFSATPQGKGVVTRVVVNGKTIRSATFVGAPRVDTPFNSELIDCGDGKPESFPVSVKGKTAYMKRGEIKFIEKLNNAIKAGASAVIFYNNEAGLVVGDLKGKVKIPVALIEQAEGERIKQEFVRGTKMTSSISNTVSDFESNSGTSMATPHVTGVVALMKSKNRFLTPVQVRDFLSKGAQKLADGPQNFYGSGLLDAEATLKLY